MMSTERAVMRVQTWMGAQGRTAGGGGGGDANGARTSERGMRTHVDTREVR